MGQAGIDADQQGGVAHQRSRFRQAGVTGKHHRSRFGRGDAFGGGPVGGAAEDHRAQAEFGREPRQQRLPGVFEPMLLRPRREWRKRRVAARRQPALGKQSVDAVGDRPGDVQPRQEIGGVEAQLFGEVAILRTDATVVAALRDDLGHQPLAAFARAEADASWRPRHPGQQPALEQALQVDRGIEAPFAQRARKAPHGAGELDQPAFAHQPAPFALRPKDQFVDGRVRLDQFVDAGLDQPCQMGIGMAAFQCRCKR